MKTEKIRVDPQSSPLRDPQRQANPSNAPAASSTAPWHEAPPSLAAKRKIHRL